MSDVYSVEEPAGLVPLLRFTPPHFGLQELAKKKEQVVLLSSSQQNQYVGRIGSSTGWINTAGSLSDSTVIIFFEPVTNETRTIMSEQTGHRRR